MRECLIMGSGSCLLKKRTARLAHPPDESQTCIHRGPWSTPIYVLSFSGPPCCFFGQRAPSRRCHTDMSPTQPGMRGKTKLAPSHRVVFPRRRPTPCTLPSQPARSMRPPANNPRVPESPYAPGLPSRSSTCISRPASKRAEPWPPCPAHPAPLQHLSLAACPLIHPQSLAMSR